MNLLMKRYEKFKFVSTGMHTLKEIIDNPFLNYYDCVFFCRSVYPCTLKQINFIDMIKIKQKLLCPVGYSSHDENGEAIKYAVLLGAKYIERHYTLDKNMKGSDHVISSDYDDMIKIIKEIKESESILGETNQDLCDEERKNKLIYRSTY